MVTARGWWREENEELLFSGYRVSIWEDKKFWRWMVVMVIKQHELLVTQKCTQKYLSIKFCYMYFRTTKISSLETISQFNKYWLKIAIKMRRTPKIDKSAHYLGRMSKQASGTKDDKDTGGHQTRSSNSLKCVFTSEVCLSLPENSAGPDHGHPLKISWSTELHSLLFYFLFFIIF